MATLSRWRDLKKEVLNGLASLFENYAGASSTERQRILEDATKRLDAALGSAQHTTTENIGDAGIEPPQKRQQPTAQHPTTSPKKNTQAQDAASLRGNRNSFKKRAYKAGTNSETYSTCKANGLSIPP